MARQSRTPEEDAIIAEWLKNNEVTVLPPGERTDPDDVTYKWKRGGRKKQTDEGQIGRAHV